MNHRGMDMLNYYYLEMRAHEKIAEALSDAARDRIALTANNARREAQRSTGATLANLLRAFAIMFGFAHSSRVSHDDQPRAHEEARERPRGY